MSAARPPVVVIPDEIPGIGKVGTSLGRLTIDQSDMLRKLLTMCISSRIAGFETWMRAGRSGERVTLASLHRSGLADRREWRPGAHEYKLSDRMREELRGVMARAREARKC